MVNEDVRSLSERVGSLLQARGEMVAVAESATGGLVGSTLTDVPGSSAYFDRALVTYSNDAKRDLLSVDQRALEEEGAVSATVARQMARGARENAGTEWGIATTGIAGPGGARPNKPVGTVFIGTAHEGNNGQAVNAKRYEFDGSRLACKEQFARQALEDLADRLR